MIFRLNIEETLKKLLLQEDTDGDNKITIEDEGPKTFSIRSINSDSYIVKGTYHLSNLLQELAISKKEGEKIAEISLTKIEELPVNRMARLISDYYWNSLIRTIDEVGITNLISDSKNEWLTAKILPVYVPHHDELALSYYKKLEAKLPIKTVQLPKDISPEYVKFLNNKPGILSLKLVTVNNEIKGSPFVVPGGRFNEMYGWDSYFESVGLLADGKVELAQAMADNFQYEIEHYGKILNANRSYYLTRTQPPFYSSLVCQVYEITQDKKWLKSHLQTVIKEYETVWMVEGKRLIKNGLNRYLAEGIGITPESEEGHYDAVLEPFAKKENMSVSDFIMAYKKNKIITEALNEYFIHDRTVRESGHDTSYRIEGNCANLNLVELNAMLYKYETDIAALIRTNFDDLFQCNDKTYTSKYWLDKAVTRKAAVDVYLWDSESGLYYDYDFVKQKKHKFIAATTLVPLWANLCSPEQAKRLVKNGLKLLKEKGGIVGCTAKSRGDISKERPQRQWDYPFGWAPHQMLIWTGLFNYGYIKEAQELIYRWLFMITKNAVDYNGTISEKYDVVKATHKVVAEYGNVGTLFSYIPDGGFGWTNASYKLGLKLLDKKYISDLNKLIDPDLILFK